MLACIKKLHNAFFQTWCAYNYHYIPQLYTISNYTFIHSKVSGAQDSQNCSVLLQSKVSGAQDSQNCSVLLQSKVSGAWDSQNCSVLQS